MNKRGWVYFFPNKNRKGITDTILGDRTAVTIGQLEPCPIRDMQTPSDKKPLGLSNAEVLARQGQYGANEIATQPQKTALQILKNQGANFILIILFIAALLSLSIGETLNFGVVSGLIVFVIVLGFIQEYRAERAMHALTVLLSPETTVRRSGALVRIKSRELVPGDIVIIEAGDNIPADGVVREVVSGRVDTSSLTGESVPEDISVGSLVYMGTRLVGGKATIEIQHIGQDTKFGEVARLISRVDEETPLQKQIKQLSKNLAYVALVACLLTLGIGIAQGAPFVEILLVSLALAVATVPEGMPLTLTLTLTHGMKRLAEKKAIVRKMLGVETLGATDVICTDKTGTLTLNKMTVEHIYCSGHNSTLSKKGEQQSMDAIRLMQAAVLCNNGSISVTSTEVAHVGDPTETALLYAAHKLGVHSVDLHNRFERVEEILFTSERKKMTVILKDAQNNGVQSITKGAPEVVLSSCTHIIENGNTRDITEEDRSRIHAANSEYARNAYRVLAFASRSLPTTHSNVDAESSMTFVGLMAMIDPPDPAAKQAIAQCTAAGIQVVMITGDNEHTAKAIAQQLGVFHPVTKTIRHKPELDHVVHDGVITGAELESLSREDFLSIVEHVFVYARIMPAQKLQIVTALKDRGHIVAMTGDGVNDAPALRAADIGIAMGKRGTDVARESSTIVLQDDNFATMIEAVRQGRSIYENIQKFTVYLISRNFTEVLLILITMITLGNEYIPLLAIHILFINTFGEVMPAVSLGLERARKDIMDHSPRKRDTGLFGRRHILFMVLMAATMAATTFFVFLTGSPTTQIHYARTLAFATVVSMILFVPSAYRSLTRPIISYGFFSHPLLLWGSLITFLSIATLMYVPRFDAILEVEPLSLSQWGGPLVGAAFVLLVAELLKHILLRKTVRKSESLHSA